MGNVVGGDVPGAPEHAIKNGGVPTHRRIVTYYISHRSEHTMNKSATFTFRLTPEVKQEASELFESLGITLSDAINLFLHQSIREGGLPFDVKQKKEKQNN